jgi:hypothetical protein
MVYHQPLKVVVVVVELLTAILIAMAVVEVVLANLAPVLIHRVVVMVVMVKERQLFSYNQLIPLEHLDQHQEDFISQVVVAAGFLIVVVMVEVELTQLE